MTPELWSSVRSEFEAAVSLPPEEREEYLQSLSSTQPELYHLVRELLATSEEAAGFLETTPWSPAEPRPAARALRPGQSLAGRFQVERHLGSGAAGDVYQAFDQVRDARVAIKTIRPGLLTQPGELVALRKELRVASLVSHPNVCRLYDITIPSPPDDAPAFISMELIEGETLSALLRRGRLKTGEALCILTQIIAGLAAAHERGVIHRDLKSGNIMLTGEPANPRAVIMDFGLAREIRPGSDWRTALTTELFAGTPAYMAPEQFEGRPATVASDIHALGVIMFEMIAGRLPFEGATPLIVAARRMQNEAPSPRAFARDVDPGWENAIHICLSRKPEKRPQSPFEILGLLSATPPNRFARRGVVAAVLTAISGGAYWLLKPDSIPAAAQESFDRANVYSSQRSPDGFLLAIREYQRALDLRPGWAEAWARLSETYSAANNHIALEPREALKKARSAAVRALELNGRLGRAHGALGLMKSLDYAEWPQAEESFRRAVALAPGDPEIRRWFAAHLRKKGLFQRAREQAEEGIRLTTRSDAQQWIELLMIVYTSRNLARFHALAAEVERLHRNDSMVQLFYARSLSLKGDFDGAQRALRFSRDLGLSPVTQTVQEALIAVLRGNAKEARRLAAELAAAARTKPVDGLLLAGVYSQTGAIDDAFAVLDRTFQRYDSTLLSLATSPAVDDLRGDPRFRALLEKLSFTAQSMQQMEFNPLSVRGFSNQPN